MKEMAENGSGKASPDVNTIRQATAIFPNVA